jgi:ubiquinone/menaquinone biosynthesis C-methylase UbiE
LRKVLHAHERRVAENERINPKDLINALSVEELCATAEDYYRQIHDPTTQMTKPFAFLQWLSRFLAQMHCYTISVDASLTALEIGKRLFRELPVLGEAIAEPRFVLFNGHTIDVADESIDRIVCFDTFHHVPNQTQVLREFFRVLKWGGVAGFSEPGRGHSQSPQSQYEMRNYRVLETTSCWKTSSKRQELSVSPMSG